jgi:hypothetical protein
VFVFGGLHGDEPKSVRLCERLIAELESVDDEMNICAMPLTNPDGFALRRRTNAAGVDLNRNFPTTNWSPVGAGTRYAPGAFPASEPETRVIMGMVERLAPSVIVAVHSISRGKFCNNFDGPGEEYALRLADRNGYPVTPSIGYPTPGSLGAWTGVERRIPTVTLELPSLASEKRIWHDNGEALLDLCLHPRG